MKNLLFLFILAVYCSSANAQMYQSKNSSSNYTLLTEKNYFILDSTKNGSKNFKKLKSFSYLHISETFAELLAIPGLEEDNLFGKIINVSVRKIEEFNFQVLSIQLDKTEKTAGERLFFAVGQKDPLTGSIVIHALNNEMKPSHTFIAHFGSEEEIAQIYRSTQFNGKKGDKYPAQF